MKPPRAFARGLRPASQAMAGGCQQRRIKARPFNYDRGREGHLTVAISEKGEFGMKKIGICFVTPAPLVKPEDLTTTARKCEELGLHSFWVIDRIAYDNLEPLVPSTCMFIGSDCIFHRKRFAGDRSPLLRIVVSIIIRPLQLLGRSASLDVSIRGMTLTPADLDRVT